MQGRNLKFSRLLLCGFLASSLLMPACHPDDETEREVITRVVLHFTGDGFDREFTWEDADGDGGNAPTVPTFELPAGKSLDCEIHVFDDSKKPTEDLTEEIKAESAAHLWTYASPLNSLQIEYADQDANGQSFGLKTRWTAASVAVGAVKITLLHEPTDKTNLAAPGGETDFSADFPVSVQ